MTTPCRIASTTYLRWAVAIDTVNGWRPLGSRCWRDAELKADPMIVTFRTRELARKTKKTCCYRDEAKVVRVHLTVSEADKDGES